MPVVAEARRTGCEAGPESGRTARRRLINRPPPGCAAPPATPRFARPSTWPLLFDALCAMPSPHLLPLAHAGLALRLLGRVASPSQRVMLTSVQRAL